MPRRKAPTDDIVIPLRPIDRKRLEGLRERSEEALHHRDIWYIHTVLTQCFMPYREPHTFRWWRQSGEFSISLIAGDVAAPQIPSGYRNAGLPYGAKPRLFQNYIHTQAIKQQSRVVPVERSMRAMVIVVVLPVAQLGVEQVDVICDAIPIQQLVELLVGDPV